MTIAPDHLADPAVRAFVLAVNAGDRAAFQKVLAPDATMSDDGSERDVADWSDREIFSSGGRMEVESEADGGRSLLVNYTNDTWGSMRTAWQFSVTADGKVSHFQTGQA